MPDPGAHAPQDADFTTDRPDPLDQYQHLLLGRGPVSNQLRYSDLPYSKKFDERLLGRALQTFWSEAFHRDIQSRPLPSAVGWEQVRETALWFAYRFARWSFLQSRLVFPEQPLVSVDPRHWFAPGNWTYRPDPRDEEWGSWQERATRFAHSVGMLDCQTVEMRRDRLTGANARHGRRSYHEIPIDYKRNLLAVKSALDPRIRGHYPTVREIVLLENDMIEEVSITIGDIGAARSLHAIQRRFQLSPSEATDLVQRTLEYFTKFRTTRNTEDLRTEILLRMDGFNARCLELSDRRGEAQGTKHIGLLLGLTKVEPGDTMAEVTDAVKLLNE